MVHFALSKPPRFIIYIFFPRSRVVVEVKSIWPSLRFCRGVFLLNAFDCLVPVIFHHPFFLEIFDLQNVRITLLSNGYKYIYIKEREKKTEKHTQAFAQAPSNSSTSFPHFDRAPLSSLTASRILFRSRQAKNRSRPSQQRSRDDRSGAMRPPSEDLELSEENHENQPILTV